MPLHTYMVRLFQLHIKSIILFGSRQHSDGAPQFEGQNRVLVGARAREGEGDTARGVEDVVQRTRGVLPGVVAPYDAAVELRWRGCHMVSSRTDVALFRNAAVENVMKFKMN